MKVNVKLKVLAFGVLLMTSGCIGGGGGGLTDLFNSLAGNSFFSGGSGGSFGQLFGLASFGVGGSEQPVTVASLISEEAATVSNPEPGTLILMGSGLAGMALRRRRKKRKARTA